MDKPFARTREEAKERGLTRYFPGELCSHGHRWYRWTKSAQCTKCVRKTDPLGTETLRAKMTVFDFYHTGKPCIRGHPGPRYVKSGGCVPCRHEQYLRVKERKSLTSAAV